MNARQPSPYALKPSEGARRYLGQFLGHATRWSRPELAFLRLVEAQGPEELLQTGELAYRGIRQLQQGAEVRQPRDGMVPLFPDQAPLALPDLVTALYAALVGAVALELGLDPPAAARGGPMAEEMSGLPNDHLLLVGRFSADVLEGLRDQGSFQGVVATVVERLSSLVELAAQSMMGADVDPFETVEYADCEACGHLLQLHVGFESWEEVRAEHRRWCPGGRGV